MRACGVKGACNQRICGVCGWKLAKNGRMSTSNTACCANGVELRGFEPLTFSLRTRRATNCAIAPRYSQKPKREIPQFANPGAVGLCSTNGTAS